MPSPHCNLRQALLRTADREKLLPGFIKVAAIGTLADVVPLVGENRVIAKIGLDMLSKGPHKVGLRSLLDICGLSGKTISPKLYVGIGISGSIQHLAGIKTSETIVSINSDPEANLHKVADFAIVGDAFQLIPEIQRRMEQHRKEAK